jgi:hypothetical protein
MRTKGPPGAATASPARWASARLLQPAFIVLALAYAVPIALKAEDQLTRVNQQARQRLIDEHRLWELQPGFRGKPEAWARMAARLLNDRQLLTRVATRYGGQSAEIELEYRRDLAIARAEVVLGALASWAAPLGAIYALGWWGVRRRKAAPPLKVEPASAADPRYRPPGQH